MPTTVLYRINGGEVCAVSFRGFNWPERDTSIWNVAIDPAFPDGQDIRDENLENPPDRQLGFAKIFVAGTVRNADAAELVSFAAAEAEDENIADRDSASDLFDLHPRFRKLFTAYSDIIKNEINILRGWHMDFKAVIASSNNLADVKAGVAGLPDLPDRNLSQLKTAIKNRMSKDD